LPRLAEGSPPLALGMELPASSRGHWALHPIENPEQSIGWTPLRARDTEGQIQEDGRIVYEEAFTGTDLVLTANHNRLVHTLVLNSPRSPADFRWRLDVPSGLKQVESSRHETSLVDARGHLRLTVRQATILAADGAVRSAQVVLGQEGEASLRVNAG